MKKIFAVLVLALSAAANAQAPAVLIEACNSIADADKRLECLKAAIGAGGHSTQAQPLNAVTRAFAGMEASLNAGISYNNYQVAVLDLAKAVAAFKQDSGETGASSAKLFESAVEAYSDAGVLWERSISFYARRGNDIAYAGGLPVSMNGLDWLVSKYSLATGKSDIWGLERGLPVQSARAEIWRIARQKVAEAQAAANPKKQDEISAKLSAPYAPIGDAPEREVATKMTIGVSCSSQPFLAALEDSPSRKEFSAKCDNGQALSIICTEGMCKGKMLQ